MTAVFFSFHLYYRYVSFPHFQHSVSIGGDALAAIQSNSKQLDLLARLMCAKAEGDAQLGMLLVGNVGVN